MQHYHHLTQAQLSGPSIVTIGVFDGVHRGHQHLIRQLTAAAKAEQATPVVLTLYPHPDYLLRGQSGRYYLTLPNEKAAHFGELGVAAVITHPFDQSVRQVRATTFVEQLLAHLRMVGLWLTADFALGYKREGTVPYLTALGAEKGFAVKVIDPLYADSNGDSDGNKISSSQIRQALAAGAVERAGELLGRPYQFTAEVIHGDHRGRTIGFPTANLDTEGENAEKLLPQSGVYACWAWWEGQRHKAVVNIGNRPTFGADNAMRVEAHLLDFTGDLYGKRLRLDFVARLRAEQKFANLAALVAQIGADAEQGRTLLG
jgi:riboflavin kinase / FMN adenylyltransferase